VSWRFWERPADPASSASGAAELPSCSFCGQSQRDVVKLIAGPADHICDACMRQSAEIVDKVRPRLPTPASAADLGARLAARVQGREELAAVLQALVVAHLSSDTGEGPPVALLVGPAGGGKTALLDALIQESGLPAVRVDAGRLTASGYVGDDLESFLGALWFRDPVLGHRGLLLVDDLQHLAAREQPVETGLDVRGTRAQRQLLRLLERRPARAIVGRRHPSLEAALVETRGLMVVLCVTLDPLPTGRAAILEAVRELGIEPALLRRVPLVLPLPRRGAQELAAVARAMVQELRTQGPVDVDEATLQALVQGAAIHPDGAWRLRQGLSAALTRGLVSRGVLGAGG